MSPASAFVLGLLISWIILIPFYVMTFWFNSVSDAYLVAFCKQACTYPLT